MTSPGADRTAIADMLTTLFDHWNPSAQEQIDAIGTENALERTGHLLGIHKSLRLLFPHNRELAYAWIRTPNEAFANRFPIEVICESGFAGLLMVRAYLDSALGH